MGADTNRGSHDFPGDFYSQTFGDTEFVVPNRYINLQPKGLGAQGMVW